MKRADLIDMLNEATIAFDYEDSSDAIELLEKKKKIDENDVNDLCFVMLDMLMNVGRKKYDEDVAIRHSFNKLFVCLWRLL